MTASRFPDAPLNIRRLPVEERGFPVPWFLAWGGVGEPDFRFVHPSRAAQAVREKRCWICGGKLGRVNTFAIGPMCAVNRISSEPPSHPDCALFAAQACPFLSRPLAKRPPKPEGYHEHFDATPGIMIERNPGVTLLWGCLRFKTWRPGLSPSVLFDLGEPIHLRWLREGRDATREEVLESIKTGLPAPAGDGQEGRGGRGAGPAGRHRQSSTASSESRVMGTPCAAKDHHYQPDTYGVCRRCGGEAPVLFVDNEIHNIRDFLIVALAPELEQYMVNEVEPQDPQATRKIVAFILDHLTGHSYGLLAKLGQQMSED